MSHAYTSLWVHAVWVTKDRKPHINPAIEQVVYRHITAELTQLGCHPIIINGTPDHIHCLFKLNTQKSIADIMKHIKGMSSYYINHNNLIPFKFTWQKGYAAFSVSKTELGRVYGYIKKQKQHHKIITIKQEMENFERLTKEIPFQES